MAYADSLLATGERIVLRERQHWFVLAYSARWALLALLAAFVLLILQAGGTLPGGPGDVLVWLTIAVFIAGAAGALWAILRWQNEEFVVTTRRIVATVGVINRRATDSSLEKINDAILTQSIFGRIFGFGDLEVLTASEAGIERLRMLVDAPGFKKAMLDAKYSLERELSGPEIAASPAASPDRAAAWSPDSSGSSPRPGAPGAMSSDEVTDTLARLADLRDRGAITAEEFEAKKADLLRRL